MDLANMNKVEAPKLDVSEYVGKYAKIADVTVEKTKYGESIKVVTEVIDTIETDGEDKENIEVVASRFFSISKEGEIIIGSKLDKFMEKQEVDQPLKLIGTKVQLLKNEKDFLTF